MKNLITIVMLFFIGGSIAPAQDALEIITKAEEKVRGASSKGEMTITTVRPKWTREMTMKMWAKGNDYSIILITHPVKEKGNVFLKREKEIWNWVPSIDRNIKLPPSMLMQSWMGTDFTNDDLVRQSSIVTDYTHKIIGTETIEGRICHKIELLPKPDAPVVWGKVLIWVDQKDYLQLKVESYDEDQYLVTTMNSSDIKEMGGRLLATKMEMIPADNPGQKTIMEYKSLEFDIDIEESFFSVQNMKRVK